MKLAVLTKIARQLIFFWSTVYILVQFRTFAGACPGRSRFALRAISACVRQPVFIGTFNCGSKKRSMPFLYNCYCRDVVPCGLPSRRDGWCDGTKKSQSARFVLALVWGDVLFWWNYGFGDSLRSLLLIVSHVIVKIFSFFF